MIRLLPAVIVCLTISISFSVAAQLNTKIYWEDDFAAAEKEKLATWLNGVSEAVADELGSYPFPVNLYLHLSDRGGEPVPWAHTVRHGEQGVHFYVNPEYPLEAFQQDWTASHELSHLSLPFLGREKMWFAEGYASFMQWYLLEKQGVLDSAVVHQKYRDRIDRAMLRLESDKPFPELCEELLQRHDYPSIYWGGACYFFQVNQQLKAEHETDLFAVIRIYQTRGRMKDKTLEELVQSLDRISGSSIFTDHLKVFIEQPASTVFKFTPTRM